MIIGGADGHFDWKIRNGAVGLRGVSVNERKLGKVRVDRQPDQASLIVPGHNRDQSATQIEQRSWEQVAILKDINEAILIINEKSAAAVVGRSGADRSDQALRNRLEFNPNGTLGYFGGNRIDNPVGIWRGGIRDGFGDNDRSYHSEQLMKVTVIWEIASVGEGFRAAHRDGV